MFADPALLLRLNVHLGDYVLYRFDDRVRIGQKQEDDISLVMFVNLSYLRADPQLVRSTQHMDWTTIVFEEVPVE